MWGWPAGAARDASFAVGFQGSRGPRGGDAGQGPEGTEEASVRHRWTVGWVAPRRLGRGAGVTIIEVLATAALLGIGLVGVGAMVTYGVIAHKKSVNYTIAAARASQELERIRQAGYVGAEVNESLFPSPTYTILDSNRAGFSLPELRDGTGTITIIEDPESLATNPDTGLPYLNLKQVQVNISWGGGRTLRGHYHAATLIANRP